MWFISSCVPFILNYYQWSFKLLGHMFQHQFQLFALESSSIHFAFEYSGAIVLILIPTSDYREDYLEWV